jgi:O-antigen ligase
VHLFDLLFGGLFFGGLRNPGVHAAAASVLWALAYVFPPAVSRLPGARIWAAWLGWLLISALLSAEPLRGLSAFSYSATAVLFLSLFRTRLNEKTRLYWLPLSAAAATVLCSAAFLIRTPSRPMIGLLFPYYNYTTAFAAAFVSAAVAAWCHGRWNGKLRYLYAGAALLCLAEIAAAGSRGALIAAAAASAFALWQSGRKRIVIYGGLLLFVLLLAAPNPWLRSRLKLSHLGAQVRPAIWDAAVSVANESPFFGEGPGQFDRGFLRHQFPTPESHRPTRFGIYTKHAHSQHLQQAAETGWPALSLFLIALFALWKNRKKDGDSDAAGAAAAAMLVTGFFENTFAMPALFWYFLSALAVCAPLPKGEPSPCAKLRPALALGLCLSLFAWWPQFETGRRRMAAFAKSGPESIQAMLGALAISPRDGDLWSDLAYLYARQGALRPGLQAILQAERLHPTNAVYFLRSAEFLRRMGEWDAVRDKALTALALEPVCPPAHLFLAETHLNKGEKAPAARELGNALRAYSPEKFDRGYDQSIRMLDTRRYGELRLKLQNLMPTPESKPL